MQLLTVAPDSFLFKGAPSCLLHTNLRGWIKRAKTLKEGRVRTCVVKSVSLPFPLLPLLFHDYLCSRFTWHSPLLFILYWLWPIDNRRIPPLESGEIQMILNHCVCVHARNTHSCLWVAKTRNENIDNLVCHRSEYLYQRIQSSEACVLLLSTSCTFKKNLRNEVLLDEKYKNENAIKEFEPILRLFYTFSVFAFYLKRQSLP